MDYERIVIELLSRGQKVRNVRCDSCGTSNYEIREECKGCGDTLFEEKQRLDSPPIDIDEPYFIDGGVRTPSQFYNAWNIPD